MAKSDDSGRFWSFLAIQACLAWCSGPVPQPRFLQIPPDSAQKTTRTGLFSGRNGHSGHSGPSSGPASGPGPDSSSGPAFAIFLLSARPVPDHFCHFYQRSGRSLSTFWTQFINVLDHPVPWVHYPALCTPPYTPPGCTSTPPAPAVPVTMPDCCMRCAGGTPWAQGSPAAWVRVSKR